MAAVASFPGPIPENRYQQLLYEELNGRGVTLVSGGRFDLGWLRRNRHTVDLLHFHWPQAYYRHRDAHSPSDRTLSVAKTALFTLRLQAARLLGYRIVWTVHQVLPHDGAGILDRVAARRLARSCALLIAHDEATAEDARRVLVRAAPEVLVVPHGSYVGVYAEGRQRAAVRADLGVEQDAVVFLCFGNVRRYKGLELLLSAFASADLPGAVLVVAGAPLDEEPAAAVRGTASRDPRVVPHFEFVPDEEVAELYGASDVAVVPRSDGGTSGAIVLALSQGLPVIAARTPTYAALLGGEDAGWLFEPNDEASLRSALEAAAADLETARRKGDVALARARELSWPAIADRVATAMLEVVA